MNSSNQLSCLIAIVAIACVTTSAPAANLLTNSEFELPSFFGYSSFNNTFWTDNANDPSLSGVGSGFILGPFFNPPNASGLFQDVVATPGDIFEASVFALNDATRLNGDGNPDTIAGTGNRFEIAIEWKDVNDDTIGVTAREVIFEGSDPSLISDEWVEGSVTSGPAPAGTVAARWLILFVQPNFDGGVVFFDNASMEFVGRIPEPASLGLVALAGLGFVGSRRRV